MKKLSFSMLAMAGLLLVGCADKDVIVEGESQEVRSDGYMSVNINLPTTPITRAANDNFDDGDADEYKVTDCALLLFQGDDENSATLINAQAVLLPFDETMPDIDNDNITTSYQATAKVKGYVSGNKLYALAVLNYKNVMSIGNDEMPKFTGATDPLTKNATLADVRKSTIDAKKVSLTTRGGSTNYFFMTNAVLSTVPGGSTDPATGEIFQLAYMDPSKIKETEKEAKAEPAGHIFVERAVAKATLKVSTAEIGDLTTTVVDAETGTATVEDVTLAIGKVRWTIDNMEPTTYVARNPGDNSYIGYSSEGLSPSYYRFVGNASVNTDASFNDPEAKNHDHGIKDPAFRTYWCIDPQYNDDNMTAVVDGEKQSGGMLPYYDEEVKTWVEALDYTYPNESSHPHYIDAGTTPLYCNENTFDVKHQSYRNTTRAIIEVTLTDGKPFWTVNGGSEIFYKQDDATSYVAASVVNNTAVIEAFKAGLNENKVEWDITKASFVIEYERDEITGQLKVTSIGVSSDVINATGEGKTFKEGFLKDIEALFNEEFIAELNKKYVVREYKDGKVYYAARFQHFAGIPNAGQTSAYFDMAPWNTWETEHKPAGGSTDASYPPKDNLLKRSQNYLGRYGMVRNNWYDVEITQFLKLGYPTDPSGQVGNEDFDDPDTPDDDLSEYISAKIHVLSWAKRMQKWGF